MEEELISFNTAKLAKQKGITIKSKDVWIDIDGETRCRVMRSKHLFENECYAPTQSLLQKFIREKRGVHIEIHRNASGYYWSMCLEDGGTDLGWSDMSGPDASGTWDSFENALECALPKDKSLILHWGNYVDFAIKTF